MRLASWWPGCVLAWLLSAIPAFSQQPQPLPDEVRERLEHRVGEWDIQTELLGRNGEVVRTTEARDSAKFIIPGKIVEVTTEAANGSISKGWMFYKSETKEFTITSVDARGDQWNLTGSLYENVITSRALPHPRGGTTTVRLTHTNIQSNSFKALMEMARDGGKTCFKRLRQYLKRR